MAAFDYADARATAEELIAEFGQVGAIRRSTITGGEAYNPIFTIVDHPCVLVQLSYDNREIDGTLIERTDRRVYVSTEGLAIEPETGDRLVIGSAQVEVVRVIPLNPAGTVVYWEVQARG